MGTITFFLRRTNIAAANRLEYLFMTCDKLDIQGEAKLISPALPGNDSSTITGSSSANFILNIGSQQMGITASGVIVDLDAGNLPTLASNSIHIVSGLQSPSAMTAQDIRNALYNFWADQSLGGTYSDFKMGWADWTTSGDIVIDSTPYRLWEGQIRTPKSSETAGEVKQYPYNMTFVVGENL